MTIKLIRCAAFYVMDVISNLLSMNGSKLILMCINIRELGDDKWKGNHDNTGRKNKK